MSHVQLSWMLLGLLIGALMLIPIQRCLSTHNGFLSMLIASIMGIFNLGHPIFAVLSAAVCFFYGMYSNQHKYLTAHNRSNGSKD